MYHIVKEHDDISRPHAIRILNNFQGFTRKSLNKMEEREWISLQGNQWALTDKGFSEAESLFDRTASENGP